MKLSSNSPIVLAALALATVAQAQTSLWIANWTSDDVVRCDLATGVCQPVFASGSGGIDKAHHFTFGPDGDLYVASWGTSSVMRYSGSDFSFKEVFVPSGSGGLLNTHTVVWGRDGNLLCAGEFTDGINRYDGQTGAFIDAFIPAGRGGLNGPEFAAYGPDGYLYVSDKVGNSIRRYHPQTGSFVDVFADGVAAGVSWGHFFTWGPDKHMYLSSSSTNEIFRFDGTTGQFIDVFVPAGSGGLGFPTGLTFNPEGTELWAASFNNSRILRYDAVTGAFLGVQFTGVGLGPLFITLMPEPGLTFQGPVPGLAGQLNELRVFRATPGEAITFAASLTNDCSQLAFCADTFLLLGFPARRYSAVRADADGHAAREILLGSGLAGVTVFLQAFEIGTCRASEVVRFELP